MVGVIYGPWASSAGQSTVASFGGGGGGGTTGGSGSGGGDVTETVTRTELTDKLATAAAQSDAKFEKLLGRIETSNAELRGEVGAMKADLRGQIGEMNARLAPLSGMKTTIIGTGVAVVALVIGVLTFGQQWFGTGVAIRDTIRATVTEMHVQASPSPPTKP